MNTDPAQTSDPLSPSARHSLHNRPIAAVPDLPEQTSTDTSAEGGPGGWFAVVLRGYDRAQVDTRLSELDRRIRDEILRGDKAEAGLSAARAHIRRLQETVAPADDRGFGVRVERVLNAAEREASDLREKAADEAAGMMEKARSDAERARQQTEEALLGRAAKLDQEFSARSAALDAREKDVDRIVERARREAEEIRAEAERAAADESAEAERRSAELLRQAERTIEQQRADATRDIGRMAALRDEIRQELGRLHGLLRGELDDAGITSGDTSRSTTDDADPLDTSNDTGMFGAIRARFGERSSRTDDEDSNARTAIGTIPPYTVASVGVLPFGDRSAGGPANGRSFAFELVPGHRGADDDQDASRDDDGDRGSASTSDDVLRDRPSPGRTPTRSTMPSRGPR